MRATAYRYPREQIILWATLLILLVLALLTAGATVCILPLLLAGVMAYAYQANRQQHQVLLQKAFRVSDNRSPKLASLVEECQRRLDPGQLDVFVVPNRQLNAYTFGLGSPQAVVLYDGLFQVMDEEELAFIVGHEMGHAALGHTWLNTLLGGMAGVPASLGLMAVFILAFRWWNRACEFSADRAGLLACGNPNKAISALVQLAAGDVDSPEELKQALEQIDQEDDHFANVLANTLSTHPMLITRIDAIRDYVKTPQYARLLSQVSRA